MNPSPDRGKECLPPKKRESRQGSVDLRPLLDEFKPPASPLRTRPVGSSGRDEGCRESSDEALTNPHSLLPSPPPPLPPPGIPLPWHLPYTPSVPLPFLPGQVGERRGSGSPSWRDDLLPSPLPHHSRWLRGEIPLPLPPCSSSSSFKSPFPADSREMWSYFNTERRDYSSSLFSPSHLFSQPPLYRPDTSMTEGRHRYLGKRPNGLDGPGSRTASASRVAPPSGEYGNEPSGRARLGGSLHGSHANGRRRHQEDPMGRSQTVAVFQDSRAPPPEGPDSHSSLQDRDPRGTPKPGTLTLIPSRPQPHRADPRAGRGELLDSLGSSPAKAQIYYSLGSMYSTLQPSHLSPQAQPFPLYSPSGSPQYGLHTMRNSQHSPQEQPNSHVTESDRERERERDRERDRRREQDIERKCEQDRDNRERDSERDRDKDSGDLSPGRQYSRPHASPLLPLTATSPPAPHHHHNPPALLPHFAKGSLIELVGGRLKRVEELRTEDFLRSANTSPEFHLSTCTILLIAPSDTHGFHHLQVLLTDRNTQELLTVLVEYPFFVRDRGWSSCCPQRTSQLYGLSCRQLSEGDICLALTPSHTPSTHTHSHTRTAPRGHRTHTRARAGASSHREDMPPPPPPPPLSHPSPALAPPPLPLPPADPSTQEQPRSRKRRWSAPDLLPPTGTTEATGTDKITNLPHGSKHRKRQ
ncbi:hormone receptor 4 [Salmo trutta]|uniref:Hormone receptor 4-like n=1 Tax=Salmo trutta TaxID=8032 RepID=A0A674AA75_SALTR|nr:hormone receptor 4-like [Salmo trutta]XP_029575747.1 hormone receptor 4-like [Salmo trutta]